MIPLEFKNFRAAAAEVAQIAERAANGIAPPALHQRGARGIRRIRDPDRQAAAAIVNEFKKVFEDESINKSGQNLKFDMQILNRYGVEVKGNLFDTMVAHFLMHPDMSHGMDAMSEAFLKHTTV